MKKQLRNALYPIAFILLFSFGNAFAQDVFTAQQHNFRIKVIAEGLEHPWGMAFLPNGNILVTERAGKLRLIKNGTLVPQEISGLPQNIYAAGQGGLLDITLDPDFANNNLVYLSYAGKSPNGDAGTEVARAKLSGMQLQDLEVIFKAMPKTRGTAHYGSRLVFDPSGALLITIGDRYKYMDKAQNPANHLGSLIRIRPDGSTPQDNPFVGREGYAPEVYSYGHRNAQGLSIRPSDGSIWLHEHGPRGGDELNRIEAGANYGWPDITYGIDYDGSVISERTHKEGMKQPVVYWTPSIAPSGMAFYDGDQFPAWRGDIFLGALAETHLRRLKMKGDEVIEQEVLLKDYARIRDVETGPDGYIYILTDEYNGQLSQLLPE